MNLTSPITLCQRADEEAQRGFDGRSCTALHLTVYILSTMLLFCLSRSVLADSMCDWCAVQGSTVSRNGAEILQVVVSSILP